MKPSQVAFRLRQIAATIDNSKSPRPDLVAADLRKIVIAVGGTPNWRKITNGVSQFLHQHLPDPGETEVLDTYSDELSELNQNYGLNFTVTHSDEGEVFLSIAYEGDSDIVWSGTPADLKQSGPSGMSMTYDVAKTAINTARQWLGA